MNTQPTFDRPIREVLHDWIPLSDGTRLAVRYWLPEDAHDNPVPALLEYIPYCKRDGTTARDEAMHPYFAGHGYASLRVDIRGSGESEGALLDEYLQQELDDCVEVIAWIAKQQWCTGSVGMFGKSWGGFNALQVAALRPPELKCIITVDSTDDRYADDVHYMGGGMNVSNATWAFSMFQSAARPPDPDAVGENWREIWQDRLEVARPWLIDWVSHQRRDAYWKHGSVCEDFSAIECAVFAVGGWSDSYTNSVLRLMQGLNAPRRALIGPWGHQYPHQSLPGPDIGYLQEALRWWDYWLKEQDTGIMDEPMIRAWMQDYAPPSAVPTHRPGRWIAELGWPADDAQLRHLNLGSSGLSMTPGAGTIDICSPQTLGESSVSWIGGGGGLPDEPTDQRIDDARSACFDMPVDEPFEFFGTPELEIDVASDKPCALICARLCDVAPDGTSSRVTYGILNLTHRDSHEHPEPLEPGKTYRVRVKLNDAAHSFAAGHTLRLALSTSYWPVVWPSPEPATLTIDLANSVLRLPVRERRAIDDTLPPFPPAVSAPVQPKTILRAPVPQVVEVVRDVRTGTVTTRQVSDNGRHRIDHTGWEFGSRSQRERSVSESDPTTAECRSVALNEWGRKGQHEFRIETQQAMRCDENDFIIEASIRAYEDGKPVLAKSWLERIPRVLV
ncbi:CocE/NonD family hydrolase [Roseovarius indicus]|uniref:Cocaine esterase n=1 Tax=Roseovarius indicus TaxID=540747 RepID=A0A0T5PC42_9RHOB|nr:hypothetical protein XM52_07845 [Roseovarius indicus]QEW25713.1 Cocaine esterase [Roseovarius indicus]SFD99913.1 hypothetical protein SAMN04488031_10444 [Roseovarius indicus]